MSAAIPDYRAIKLGWNPSRPDFRDHPLSLAAPAQFAPSVDLRPALFPVYDQGPEGSCTAFAVSAAFRHARRVQRHWHGNAGPSIKHRNGEDYDPSAAFLYYNARLVEGSTSFDAGATLRDAVKVINTYGAPAWHNMPYVAGQFTVEPSVQVYKNAANHELVKYESLDGSLAHYKTALAAGRLPVLGFTVYESFYHVGADGLVPLPSRSEQVIGGHAIAIVGYDDALAGGRFIVRNSWGAFWGDAGYAYFPYDYLTNPGLADDAWILETVTS